MGHEIKVTREVESLGEYTQDIRSRLDGLPVVLQDGLRITSDVDELNRLFGISGRNDLKLLDPVRLRAFDTVAEFSAASETFGRKFNVLGNETEIQRLANLQGNETSIQHFFAQHRDLGHLDTRSLYRMLSILPEFTLDLFRRGGNTDGKSSPNLVPELFVAYQIMSRLVSRSDAFVRGQYGMVDRDFLLK